MSEYTYGGIHDDDEWDEDDFRASGGDKHKVRDELMCCIMQMPTEKAWEYITYLNEQDGCMADDEINRWEQAVANNDLKAAVMSVVIQRDYISAYWGNRMIDELITNNYYKGVKE
tara:strand:+ start:29741 stop:30085 length:345 start_codon:yes stop_codon:yes gene_type:complete